MPPPLMLKLTNPKAGNQLGLWPIAKPTSKTLKVVIK